MPRQRAGQPRRGEALYNEELAPVLDTRENFGKLLSVDVDSGDWEMGEDGDDVEILDALQARRPKARIYTLKIGYETPVSLAGGLTPLHDWSGE